MALELLNQCRVYGEECRFTRLNRDSIREFYNRHQRAIDVTILVGVMIGLGATLPYIPPVGP